MAFQLQALVDVLLAQFHPFVTSPAPGAILKRVSPRYPLPNGEVLGTVIASPNILRPYHNGFNPSTAERCRFECDFFDKLIYISTPDAQSEPVMTAAISQLYSLFGRLQDPEPSTGCSPGSCGTPLYRMVFTKDGSGHVVRVDFPPDANTYTAVAAKFANPEKPGMSCTEFWIALHEDRDLILNTPEYAAARKRSEDNCPPDAIRRRQRTLEQIDRLRKSDASTVFQTSGCGSA